MEMRAITLKGSKGDMLVVEYQGGETWGVILPDLNEPKEFSPFREGANKMLSFIAQSLHLDTDERTNLQQALRLLGVIGHR